ncbi:hypothetical protein ABGB18_33350 [Nonomuraea sp. B12E4]|uniref:hypothetical protein n=1 Tax=Nonomuraea sp. B12E4 TaxID=3153564 RepID=UPI00325F80C7
MNAKIGLPPADPADFAAQLSAALHLQNTRLEEPLADEQAKIPAGADRAPVTPA